MSSGTLYKCEECGWTGTEGEMGELEAANERVLSGELMPAGECPECGALIEVADEDVPDYTLHRCIRIAHDRGYFLEEN